MLTLYDLLTGYLPPLCPAPDSWTHTILATPVKHIALADDQWRLDGRYPQSLAVLPPPTAPPDNWTVSKVVPHLIGAGVIALAVATSPSAEAQWPAAAVEIAVRARLPLLGPTTDADPTQLRALLQSHQVDVLHQQQAQHARLRQAAARWDADPDGLTDWLRRELAPTATVGVHQPEDGVPAVLDGEAGCAHVYAQVRDGAIPTAAAITDKQSLLLHPIGLHRPYPVLVVAGPRTWSAHHRDLVAHAARLLVHARRAAAEHSICDAEMAIRPAPRSGPPAPRSAR